MSERDRGSDFSGGSLIMNFDEVAMFVNLVKIEGEAVRGQLQGLREAMDGLVTTGDFSGSGKVGIDKIIRDQHIPMIMALETCYLKIFSQTREMIGVAMDFFSEQDEEAVFEHDELLVLQRNLGRVYDIKEELDDEFQMLYKRVNGLVDGDIQMPLSGGFSREFGSAEQVVRNLVDQVEDFRFDWSEISGLNDEISIYLRKLEAVSDLPLQSVERMKAWGDVEEGGFASRMRSQHSEHVEVERLRMDELIESWQGVHPHVAFHNSPQSMSVEEQSSWIMHLDSMVIGMDMDESKRFRSQVMDFLPKVGRGEIVFEDACRSFGLYVYD